MSFAPALMEAVLLLDERHLRDILTRIPDANERAATVNTPNNIGLTALMMAASYNHDRIRLRNHMGLIPASPSQTRRMM